MFTINNKVNKLTSASLALLMAFSIALPTAALAKNDNGKSNSKGNGAQVSASVKANVKHDSEDNDNDKDDNATTTKHENKQNGNFASCVKAFGHLIAPGWIKRNGVPQTDPNCVLPFGIAKKLFHSGTTTPPVVDTTAPAISNIIARAGNNFAVITWSTNEKSSGKLYWSSTSPVDTNSANVVSTMFNGTFHFAFVSGLSASTTYYGVITAKDSAGNTATSSQFSFTTGGGTVIIPDTTAPVISGISENVSSTSVNVMWQTNENADSKVFYSTTTPLNTSLAAFVSSSSFVASHSLNLTGLATGTLYYMQIVSKDASNNTATSSEFSTTTLSL